MYKKTKVVNVDSGQTQNADILEKSDKRLKVAIDNTDITLVMTKQTPHSKNYVGTLYNMELVSTGE